MNEINILKSFKYNKLSDILTHLYSHYEYIFTDDNYFIPYAHINKIKKCFKNKKYIIKYIYYYRKSEVNILDNFIELITLLVNPSKYIKDVPDEIFCIEYSYNKYLFEIIDYAIKYFKIKKSKLYLKIKESFKKIIHEYFTIIISNLKNAKSYPKFDNFERIRFIENDIFIIFKYAKDNIKDIVEDVIINYNKSMEATMYISSYIHDKKNILNFKNNIQITEKILHNIPKIILNIMELNSNKMLIYIFVMSIYLLSINYKIIELNNILKKFTYDGFLLFEYAIIFYRKTNINILELKDYFNYIVKELAGYDDKSYYLCIIFENYEYLTSKSEYIDFIRDFISNNIFYQIDNIKCLKLIYECNTRYVKNKIFVNIIKENILYYNLANAIEFKELHE